MVELFTSGTTGLLFPFLSSLLFVASVLRDMEANK